MSATSSLEAQVAAKRREFDLLLRSEVALLVAEGHSRAEAGQVLLARMGMSVASSFVATADLERTMRTHGLEREAALHALVLRSEFARLVREERLAPLAALESLLHRLRTHRGAQASDEDVQEVLPDTSSAADGADLDATHEPASTSPRRSLALPLVEPSGVTLRVESGARLERRKRQLVLDERDGASAADDADGLPKRPRAVEDIAGPRLPSPVTAASSATERSRASQLDARSSHRHPADRTARLARADAAESAEVGASSSLPSSASSASSTTASTTPSLGPLLAPPSFAGDQSVEVPVVAVTAAVDHA